MLSLHEKKTSTPPFIFLFSQYPECLQRVHSTHLGQTREEKQRRTRRKHTLTYRTTTQAQHRNVNNFSFTLSLEYQVVGDGGEKTPKKRRKRTTEPYFLSPVFSLERESEMRTTRGGGGYGCKYTYVDDVCMNYLKYTAHKVLINVGLFFWPWKVKRVRRTERQSRRYVQSNPRMSLYED